VIGNGKCRVCGAEVLACSVPNAGDLDINPKPDVQGNLVINQPPTPGRHVSAALVAYADWPKYPERYSAHKVTCPGRDAKPPKRRPAPAAKDGSWEQLDMFGQAS
jgi:hypothetical protein